MGATVSSSHGSSILSIGPSPCFEIRRKTATGRRSRCAKEPSVLVASGTSLLRWAICSDNARSRRRKPLGGETLHTRVCLRGASRQFHTFLVPKGGTQC